MRYNHHNNNDIRKKIEDYSYGLNDFIGKGLTSIVYRGINQKSKQPVAIKVIDLKSIRDRPAKNFLQGQIQALRKLSHPNIMKCHDIFSTVNNCYIITQFCNQGDLQCLLKKKRGKLPQQQAIPILRDIFLGLKHITESGFLHRDLKPANILLNENVAKIADFGFAKKVGLSSKQLINVGSPLYMSPESLFSNIYTVKSDIWSLGVMFYEILHGKAPWQCTSQEQLKQKIIKASVSYMKNISQDLKNFIKCCLTVDQQKRISFPEMIKHSFIIRITQQNDLPILLKKPTILQKPRQNKSKDQKLFEKKDISKEKQKQFKFPSKEEIPQQKHHIHSIFHRKQNQPASLQTRAQKQISSQINWMRFLYKLNQMFPPAKESSRYTLGLRYILVKQLFSQLNSIKQAFLTKQNIFYIEGWEQLVNDVQKSKKYLQMIGSYKQKYAKLNESFQEWGKYVTKDKKLSSIVDENFLRSESLSILGINFVIQECRRVWKQLCEIDKKQSVLNDKFESQALRLDFMMSYYQLNCILVDKFYDSDFFCRQCRLDQILQIKPVRLQKQNLRQLGHKLQSLYILKC